MRIRRGFICAGCWALDRIKVIDAWPVEEQLAYIIHNDRQGGGSGFNVGIDLRKLDPDMPVEAIGLLGQDDDGDFLLEQAIAHGIDTRQLHRTDQACTAYTDVMTARDTGHRTFFHHSGANALLAPAQFDFTGSTSALLHLGLLGVHERLDSLQPSGDNGWVEILRAARQTGLQTSMELVSIAAARIRELALPCLAHLDVLIVNDYEIGSLAGIDTLDADGRAVTARCEEAARAVLPLGSMNLVTVHYPGGAVCVMRDGTVHRTDSLRVDPATIRGSVGAGDAFAAGMLYALHEQWSVPDALHLAHAVAAASLRSATTVGAVDSVEVCLALADRSVAEASI